MATNDTDPQRTHPFPEEGNDTPDAAADAAASLLANLSDSAQPTEDVKETEGHIAASYAVAPHRPPRANDKTVENPAVLINATVPLPQPPSSARMKLGPPAPSVVSMNGAPTVVGAPSLFAPTDPAERSRNQMRLLLACIAGVVGAALIAIVILALMPARTQPNAGSSSSSTSSPSAAVAVPSSSPTTPSATASAVQTPSSPVAAPTTTTTAASKPTTTSPHGRPHGSASPSTRPSGNFAEPDRNL